MSVRRTGCLVWWEVEEAVDYIEVYTELLNDRRGGFSSQFLKDILLKCIAKLITLVSFN